MAAGIGTIIQFGNNLMCNVYQEFDRLEGLPPGMGLKTETKDRKGYDGHLVHIIGERGDVKSIEGEKAFSSASNMIAFENACKLQQGYTVMVIDDWGQHSGPFLVLSVDRVERSPYVDGLGNVCMVRMKYELQAL